MVCYSLCHVTHTFMGRRAIDTIMEHMSGDNSDPESATKVTFIFAGYKSEMANFKVLAHPSCPPLLRSPPSCGTRQGNVFSSENEPGNVQPHRLHL
jgi:hypothetical protein